MSKQYVVSACLAGESCRYDGGLLSLSGGTSAGPHGAGPAGVPGSPRGLPTPARASEIRDGRVVAKDGRT